MEFITDKSKIYLFSYDTTDLAGPIALTGNYGISQKQFIDDININDTIGLYSNHKLIKTMIVTNRVNNNLFLNSDALPIAPKFMLLANFSATVAIIYN